MRLKILQLITVMSLFIMALFMGQFSHHLESCYRGEYVEALRWKHNLKPLVVKCHLKNLFAERDSMSLTKWQVRAVANSLSRVNNLIGQNSWRSANPLRLVIDLQSPFELRYHKDQWIMGAEWLIDQPKFEMALFQIFGAGKKPVLTSERLTLINLEVAMLTGRFSPFDGAGENLGNLTKELSYPGGLVSKTNYCSWSRRSAFHYHNCPRFDSGNEPSQWALSGWLSGVLWMAFQELRLVDQLKIQKAYLESPRLWEIESEWLRQQIHSFDPRSLYHWTLRRASSLCGLYGKAGENWLHATGQVLGKLGYHEKSAKLYALYVQPDVQHLIGDRIHSESFWVRISSNYQVIQKGSQAQTLPAPASKVKFQSVFVIYCEEPPIKVLKHLAARRVNFVEICDAEVLNPRVSLYRQLKDLKSFKRLSFISIHRASLMMMIELTDIDLDKTSWIDLKSALGWRSVEFDKRHKIFFPKSVYPAVLAYRE